MKEPIAVVGMAGRVPGASDVTAFWSNVRQGVESVSFFGDEELLARGVAPSLLQHPDYVRAAGVLDDVEGFDAGFFGFTPRDAEITDPQHRLFLEVSWHALEDAGYAGEPAPDRVGLFAGCGPTAYLWTNVLPALEAAGLFDPLQARLRNDKDFFTTWVSYKLGLEGPSVDVQTACSTSLVAVHYACESLRSGECDMALAGGAFVGLPHGVGYVHQRGGVMSPDGHCRPFDAGGHGIVMGSGAGAVVLKRLSDAVRDRDHIHAVVRGSAVNNDGRGRAGFTAPSVDGQAAAVREALQAAGVGADTIGYVEAHGTGTALGDPIEIEALTLAFEGAPRQGCALGSAKANIGHLDAAAGVIGLIKAVLALRHAEIPPVANFTAPNPLLELERTPFDVPAVLRSWPSTSSPRRAGVSSLGMGGTNAHVVLEEAPVVEAPTADAPAPVPVLLPLAARSPQALRRLADELAARLDTAEDVSLLDVARTLQVGRRHFDARTFVVAAGPQDLVARLRDAGYVLARTATAAPSPPPVAFVFPGQGAQRTDMALDLYQDAGSAFRAALDECADLLRGRLGWDVRGFLYPSLFERGDAPTDYTIDSTAVAQPVLFSVEYALAQQWQAWGVEPASMVGHSVGEYVAACLAGVFALPDAVRLVAERGRLMQSCAPGAMLAVRASVDEARALFSSVDDEGLSVAAVNAPRSCVVAGPRRTIEELAEVAEAKGITAQVMHASHAFHSPSMEPILAEFGQRVAEVPLHAPSVPLLSNTSGTWLRDDEATDPAYWARHVRETVRFADNVGELLATDASVLLEVGPPALAGIVRQHPRWDSTRTVVASLPRTDGGDDARVHLLDAVGHLWVRGTRVRWDVVGSADARRVPLPLYPFERRRYWLEPPVTVTQVVVPAVEVTPEPEPVVDVVTSMPAPVGAAPAADAEAVMLGIFRDVFGMADIKPTDNFFDLGGDSLTAIQLANRILERLGAELHVEVLFDAEDVADLARAVMEGKP